MQAPTKALVHTTASPSPNPLPRSDNSFLSSDASFASLMAVATREHHALCLEPARRTLSAACAEYSYFGPQRVREVFAEAGELPKQSKDPAGATKSRTSSRSEERKVLQKLGEAEGEDEACPDPEQMKLDLRTLHSRFVVLSSYEADEVYLRIAQAVREAANDEDSGFRWTLFQVVVAGGLRELRDVGLVVEVGDLVTLPLLRGLIDARGTERGSGQGL